MAETSFAGSWVGISAGGCFNFASWRCNPQLFLNAEKAGTFQVTLVQKGKNNHHIGFYVATCSGDGYRVLDIDPDQLVCKVPFVNEKEVTAKFTIKDPEQTYVIIPCTFKKGVQCEFRLLFKSKVEFTIQAVKAEKEYRITSQQGKWEGSSAGGCKNNPTVANNPQFSLEAKRGVITITLSQTQKDEFDSIGLYVAKIGHSQSRKSSVKPNSPVLGPGLSPVVKQRKDSKETHEQLRIKKT